MSEGGGSVFFKAKLDGIGSDLHLPHHSVITCGQEVPAACSHATR